MKQSRFVIFTAPTNLIAPGSCYLAPDGTPTMMQTNAARFDTFACAKEFAKANHITFNGHTYIGIEDFPLFDEQLWASLDQEDN